MKNFLLAIVCSLALMQVQAQDKLPSVVIENSKGQKVNIQSFGENGKITILSFWGTFCKPCIKELDNIAEVYEDWQDEYDCELVAVAIDDSRNAAKAKSLAAGKGWEYEILMDKNQDLRRALNFQAVPYSLIVDQKGNIVYKHATYSEGDEEEMEEKLQELSK